MGTIGVIPGRPVGWPQWKPQPYRRREPPHPMDIHSGEFRKGVIITRLIALDSRAEDIRAFGTKLVDGVPRQMRPLGWCEADDVFVRLMVITRLDRSVCDEEA